MVPGSQTWGTVAVLRIQVAARRTCLSRHAPQGADRSCQLPVVTCVNGCRDPFDNSMMGTVGCPLPGVELRLEAVPELGYLPNDSKAPKGEVRHAVCWRVQNHTRLAYYASPLAPGQSGCPAFLWLWGLAVVWGRKKDRMWLSCHVCAPFLQCNQGLAVCLACRCVCVVQ